MSAFIHFYTKLVGVSKIERSLYKSKKFVSVLCTALCISLLLSAYSATAATDESGETAVDVQAPGYYTSEYQEQLAETNATIDAFLEGLSSRVMTRSVVYNVLSVPLFQQSNSWYCGPASGQMVLKYITGTTYSQATLANSMGTTSSAGTYVYAIKNTLNAYQNEFTFEYVLDSSYPIWNSILYGVSVDCPIVAHVQTSVLPYYGGHVSGHYIAVTGYYYGTYSSTTDQLIYCNDPNNNDNFYGAHSCAASVMSTAIQTGNGYYIRASS